MHIPLLSLAALFGATQGILLGVIVLSVQRGRLLANQLLAGFLFAESLRLGVLMFTYGDWVLATPWLYLLLNVTYAIGPLLYGYTRAMTQPTFTLQAQHGLHLLPLIISTAVCALLLSQFDWQQIDTQSPEQSRAYWWGIVLSIFGFASLLVYALAAQALLKPYQTIITAQFSDIEKINLQWLRLLIYFCLATALVSATIEFTRLLTDLYVGPRILASLLMSVMMIYSIGIMGIRQPAILGSGEWMLSPQASAEIGNPATTASTGDAPVIEEEATGKYLKSGLNQEESELFWEKLLQHMQTQKPYLENGLKLSELADQMDLLSNHLSQIINTHAGKSFFDFVNEYRVETAKTLLRDADKQRHSVASIALDAGFNSQNTFYNQFKKYTGTTPSKYKKQQH